MKQAANGFKGTFPKKKSGKSLANTTIKKKVHLYESSEDFGMVVGLTFGVAVLTTCVAGVVYTFSSLELMLLTKISLGFVATVFAFLSAVTYASSYEGALGAMGNPQTKHLKSGKALLTSAVKLPMKKKETLINKFYTNDGNIPADFKTLIKPSSSDMHSIFRSPYEVKSYQVQTSSGIFIEQRIEPTALALWDNTLIETKDLYNLELLVNDSGKYLEMESKK